MPRDWLDSLALALNMPIKTAQPYWGTREDTYGPARTLSLCQILIGYRADAVIACAACTCWFTLVSHASASSTTNSTSTVGAG